MKTEKTQPIGICDHCLGPIKPQEWYTRRGPRLCCCNACKNALIGLRHAAPANHKRLAAQVAAGTWTNPHLAHPPTGPEQSRRARLARRREVAAGAWRNPAKTTAAREKLSRPRKHTGPLAAAMEKLKHGRMADLTPEEASAYRAYRRDLAKQKTR